MAKPRNEATEVFRQFAWHLAGKLTAIGSRQSAVGGRVPLPLAGEGDRPRGGGEGGNAH
jgi:hypothetical protein